MKADGSGMEEPILPHPLIISVWPHRIAVILVGATFPLLFIGGLVTGKGGTGRAGLADQFWLQHVPLSVVENGWQYFLRA